MSEEITTHVFTVVVQIGAKTDKVELFDFSGGEPVALATGSAFSWRSALGEALSKISLSSDKPEKTVNDVAKEQAEGEGETLQERADRTNPYLLKETEEKGDE